MESNQDLLIRRNAAVPRGVSTATQIFAERAENGEIWDAEGRRYIDFVGGIAVLATGHRHPKVIAAVQEQLEKFTHVAFQVTAYESYVALAERLNVLAPMSEPAKTVLFTTGAEATENAIKIARGATGRSAVIAFTGGFHGRTQLASAMTGKVKPYKQSFGPPAPEVYHVPFPIEHQGGSVEDSLRALDFLFAATVAPERVAAIIIEPVQGEGGFHVAPTGLLQALREICDRHGIVLIADEVQCGFGRTGRMFGIEHSGVEPDLITVAKSIAGGFPLSGVIGRARILDAIDPGGLGGTYGGSPIGCAAALAVLDVIEEEGLLTKAMEQGGRVRSRLRRMSQRNDLIPIGNIRGLGAMLGFDLLDGQGKGDPAAVKTVMAGALDRGLILLSCGAQGEAIRLLPALTMADAVLDEGLDLLEQALEAKVA